MAPGVALLDYDNDGDLDVYVVQGQMLGAGKTVRDATFPPKGALEDRLFRNDLVVNPDGTRTLRFTDVTEQSGIDVRSYGMGVATGDFDNDGWVDIYRTGLAGSVLLHNNGDGTFTDVTKKAGAANPGGWGVSAAFVDYDRDGWLDLFVGNYLIYSLAADVHCLSVAGQRDYCPPNSYRAQPSRLYHNRRNGTFEDVTGKALVGGALRPRARRLDRRLQRRRVDGHLRRQRRRAESALDQSAQRDVQGDGATGRRGRQRRGQCGSGHGRRRRRFRQRRRRGSVRHQLAEPDEHAVRQRRVGELRRSESGVRARPAEPGEDRLRHRLVRFRQRRLAGSAGGQRQRRDHRSAGAREAIPFRCACPTSCTATCATGISRTCPIAPARCSSWPTSVAARRSATSTTTATSTSSSATPRARCGCSRTTSATGLTGSGSGWSACPGVGGRANAAGYARRAGRDCSRRAADALSTRARRWELRVGQRSARARGSRRVGGGRARPGHLAGRRQGGVVAGPGGSVDDAEGRHVPTLAHADPGNPRMARNYERTLLTEARLRRALRDSRASVLIRAIRVYPRIRSAPSGLPYNEPASRYRGCPLQGASHDTPNHA